MSWQAQLISLHPDMFPGPLGHSLAGRALDAGTWSLDCINLRDFGTGRHQSVDDTPAGGGAGMVIKADIAAAAIDAAQAKQPDLPLLIMSPRGKPLTQERVRTLSLGPGALIFCGRFEAVDERVIGARNGEEISIGDYILSGGETAALVLLDAVIRLLPGVMGGAFSADDESFERGLLEYPHYTRPAIWEGIEIPPVLLSGDHAAIADWRQTSAELLTKERRPDLWQKYLKKIEKTSD